MQSGIVEGFKGIFVCFLAQGRFYCQNTILNFYPKVNDLFNNFLKVNLLKKNHHQKRVPKPEISNLHRHDDQELAKLAVTCQSVMETNQITMH